LPSIDGVDITYIDAARNIVTVNNQTSMSTSFRYEVFPKQEGVITIPSMTLNAGGQNFASQEITITVIPSSGSSSGGAARPTRIEDRLFVHLEIPQEPVFIGQPIPFKVKLYIHQLPVQNIELPQLETIGFQMKDFSGQPKQYQQTLNGLAFNVVEFETIIYPTRSGTITIGPANVVTYVLTENGQRSGGLMDTFFRRQRTRNLTATSEPVILRVDDLPQAGRPDSFTGAVGHYQMGVDLSPKKVQLGDPITLRMKVVGDGNIKSLTLPSPPTPRIT